MSHLTEQQKETALNAQYAIKTALVELSEINHLEKALCSLGDDGLTLFKSAKAAINELRTAKLLSNSLVDKAVTCNANVLVFPAASTTESTINPPDVSDLVSLANSATLRIIKGMISRVSQNEQAKAEAIIQLCKSMDNGTLQFSDDYAEGAFFALMALALHDELREGGV